MKAAELLHVAPWELAKQPKCYMDWAFVMSAAEAEAPDAGTPKKVGE
jgi:hypothetical protein